MSTREPTNETSERAPNAVNRTAFSSGGIESSTRERFLMSCGNEVRGGGAACGEFNRQPRERWCPG